MSLILISAVFATVPAPSNSDAGATAIQNRRGALPVNAGITFRMEPKTTPSVSEIDDAVKAVMEKGHVRGAALAIVKGTHLVYTKGYTLAGANYPDVRPVTYFRQASVSKMVSAEQLASYCASEKLWATPGDRARQAYNNTGYLMLSLAVTKLRNAPSFPTTRVS
jgi:CubicO group peptidase (beta-lactamase class C family)